MNTQNTHWGIIFLAIATMGAIGGLGYISYTKHSALKTLERKNTTLEEALAKTKAESRITEDGLLATIEDLKQLLAATNADKENAVQDLHQQKEVVDAISNTLTAYDKIVNTDRELLMKYSRVYFLNENYSPRYSTTVPSSYVYEPSIEKLYLSQAWPFLKTMLDDAAKEGVDLKILSAYRSFDTQTKLKNAYTVTYGINSNKFSADQGYSEHQLGTAVDFTTSKLGAKYTTFEKTASYTWLTQNAYRYGFVLSYPKKNAYYIFEPWHWRFVGKALALKLHNENKNFVDLEQRDINEFLASLFDGAPQGGN